MILDEKQGKERREDEGMIGRRSERAASFGCGQLPPEVLATQKSADDVIEGYSAQTSIVLPRWSTSFELGPFLLSCSDAISNRFCLVFFSSLCEVSMMLPSSDDFVTPIRSSSWSTESSTFDPLTLFPLLCSAKTLYHYSIQFRSSNCFADVLTTAQT